jgi:valyl-tRNA synthetase
MLVPGEDRLPVDPSSDVPDGFDEAQRGQPGGFRGEVDIMDTWATSSLTPQIATLWEEDPEHFARTFPMDVRPQAHEIIRTWLFSTVVRAELEHSELPWRNASISGWVLDPDRKKMSKSKGNVVTPMGLLEQYGSDAVRYWAASGRPGTDTAFDEGQMKVGRRLAMKVLNASRFTLGVGAADAPSSSLGDVTEPIDRALLAALAALVDEVTVAFEGYDYARALERTETFFWAFCDDHLELVKGRAYGDGAGAASARAALEEALSVLLRLFAPFLPFVTEEVWSWWQDGSIHRAAWPEAEALRAAAGDADPLVPAVAAHVLGEIRKAKTTAQKSLRAEVERVVVRDTAERLAALAQAESDVRDAGRVASVEPETVASADGARVDVTLAAD